MELFLPTQNSEAPIEHCRIIPSAMMMDRIADALGKPVARIFFQPGDKSIYKREA
jgi:transcriptional regulator with XRE-family HTH domain